MVIDVKSCFSSSDSGVGACPTERHTKGTTGGDTETYTMTEIYMSDRPEISEFR